MMKKIAAAMTACLLFISSVFCVSAAVEYTSGPTGGKSIYIAGNPDLYPIEYYDADTKTYQGILPTLYAQISESTGLGFTYIRSGSDNVQNRLAKNRQAEIISAHRKGEVEALSDEVLLLFYEKGGETIEIYVGFTDIAGDAVVSTVKEAIEKIPDSELLSLALQVSGQPQKTDTVLWLIAVIVVLLVVIAVLVVSHVKRKLQDKKDLQNTLTDPLTGIGNANYFKQNMKSLITPDSYSLYYIGYLSADMQSIEKYLGTTQSEEILRYAANVLTNSEDNLDFTARISNGAFLHAFQAPSEASASERMNELLIKLNYSEKQIEKEYRTLFRAGIFHMTEANIPFETIVVYSRQGWQAAEQKKQLYVFADNQLIREEASKEKLQRSLTKAIDNREFKMYMQFIVDAASGEIQGAEAISRWQHPESGLLSPSRYIEAMHLSGEIKRLDFAVLEETCRKLEEWSKTDKRNFWISCNFTRATVCESDFAKRFLETVNRYSFERDNLVIELTEDALADDKAVAYQNVLECKKAGFRIALDDMGSGYSSLSDLCDYPIDIIKIDRHIVEKSTTERGNALLQGITRMAHGLGIEVLCEGVETENEKINCIHAGCEYIQGFYYSHVLPQEETDTFLAKYQAANQ